MSDRAIAAITPDLWYASTPHLKKMAPQFEKKHFREHLIDIYKREKFNHIRILCVMLTLS